MLKNTYIDHIIIKQQPKIMAFNNTDVVASVRTTSTVDNHSH